jgi:hypothetical protein
VPVMRGIASAAAPGESAAKPGVVKKTSIVKNARRKIKPAGNFLTQAIKF